MLRFVKTVFALLLLLCLASCNATDDSSQSRVVEGMIGIYYDTEELVTIQDCGKIVSLNAVENATADLILPTDFPNGMKINYVGEFAFLNNDVIVNVTVPDGYEYIGMGSFACATELKTVYIGKDVHTIEESAFMGCNSIESITISDDNLFLYVDNNAIVTKEDKKLLFSTNYIPNDITVICASSLRENKTLGKVVVPKNVLVIEGYSFCDSALSAIELPNGVTKIGKHAFKNTQLKEIFIPISVVELEEAVFDEINGIVINCEAESQPEGWDAKWLDGCTNYQLNWGVERD